MRPRRRSFRRWRIARNHTDWVQVVAICPDELPVLLCEDGVVPHQDAPFTSTMLDHQDVVDHTDKLTVLRIVGDVGYRWRPPDAGTSPFKDFNAGVIICEGIYVASLDGAGQFLPQDAADIGDGEGSWMWRNTRWMVPLSPFLVGSTPGIFVAPAVDMHHLDVPVKRILRDRNILVYTATAVCDSLNGGETSVAGALCAVTVNLRVLVTSSG